MKSKKKTIERYGIPPGAKIGPYDYRVSFCSYDSLPEESFADTNRATAEILIQEGLSRSVTWIVLFREILRILNPTFKLSVVEPLAASLFSFINDNNFPQKKIPSTVKIGPYEFQVILCDTLELPDERGENYRHNMKVKLRKGMPPKILWGIFLHECLHGMNYGLNEKTIEYLSTLLLITLDDLKLLRC